MRVFVAGGGGAIGRQLLPLLVAAGHEVTATTRSPERANTIRAAGARAVIVDAYERAALIDAVVRSHAQVVIHQLTALATSRGVPLSDRELERNARIREEGTANLVAATVAAGAHRLIAQSVAWLYAPGPEPHDEEDPLLLLAPSASATLQGVHALERQVAGDDRFEGVVLRYGRLYGQGAWTLVPPEPPSVRVEAAALAAALSVEHGPPGIYNIVDDGGPVSNRKGRKVLAWEP